jgi:predicted O-linked N-acetylglucosamine transferase (SPINDLY family)
MPDSSTQPLLKSALRLRQDRRLDEAKAVCEQILLDYPNQADALHLLGVLIWEMGSPSNAIEPLQRATRLSGDRWDFFNTLGLVHSALGQKEEAIAAFRQAVSARSKNPPPDALFNLAEALRSVRRPREAIAAYRQALASRPDFPAALVNLGITLQSSGQSQEALAALRRATVVAPDSVDAWIFLGSALKDSEQPEEALAAFRRAAAIDPNSLPAQLNLGLGLWAKGELNEAIAALQKSLALDPSDAATQHHLAGALRAAGRFEEAIPAYERALQLNPNLVEAHLNMGSALKDIGEIEQAMTEFETFLAARPDSLVAQSHRLYALHLHPDYDPAKVFAEHLRWNREIAAPHRTDVRRHKNDRSPDRVLRIGYISPDLNDHSVGFFFENLLAGHDPAVVEVYCYSDSRKKDKVTERLRNLCPNWRDVYGKDDARVAEMFRKDRIDILVDLAGHTPGNRILLFLRKPAPIQVTYLGYPDTTGLLEVDYRLTDAVADPIDQTVQWHTEQLFRLPDSFLCMGRMETAPDITPLPALSAGYVTFGSFNTLSKVNNRLLQWWAKILAQVPSSRLLIKSINGLNDPRPRRRVLKQFTDAGIDPHRIELQSALPDKKSHLDLYRRVDIGLDTYPYHGTTITCEALWMGVPIVTLAGRTHVSRVGVSLLSSASLGDLVAQTPEEYVSRAVALAGDLPRLAEIRATLRTRLAQSPLTNPQTFARNVEAAYQDMWRRWRHK